MSDLKANAVARQIVRIQYSIFISPSLHTFHPGTMALPPRRTYTHTKSSLCCKQTPFSPSSCSLSVCSLTFLPQPAHIPTFIDSPDCRESIDAMLDEASSLSDDLFALQEVCPHSVPCCASTNASYSFSSPQTSPSHPRQERNSRLPIYIKRPKLLQLWNTRMCVPLISQSLITRHTGYTAISFKHSPSGRPRSKQWLPLSSWPQIGTLSPPKPFQRRPSNS